MARAWTVVVSGGAAAAARSLFIPWTPLTWRFLSLSLSLSLLRAAVVEDEEMGNILQLQGDQRDAVGKFLTENEIVEAKKIKKHGAG